MNAWKRAWLYTVRQKGKTFTLLSFLFVTATMMLMCLAIQSATRVAQDNIRKALLAHFTINAKHTETGITEHTVREILTMDGVGSRYALRSYDYVRYADAHGTPLEIETLGNTRVPEGYERVGKAVGCSNSETDMQFLSGALELTSGSPIAPGSTNDVIIHEDLSWHNDLALGDTILLESMEGGKRTAPLNIVGIFRGTQSRPSDAPAASCDLAANTVFTTPEVLSSLLYEDAAQTGVQYADFYVTNPEDLDQVMAAVQQLPGLDWNECILTKYEADYLNAKQFLDGLRNLTQTALIVLLIAFFSVLALFLLLRFRDRIHETGTYLAIGISKGSMLSQFLLETFLVAVLSLALSFGASSFLCARIGDEFLLKVSANSDVTVNLNKRDESLAQRNSPVDPDLADIELTASGKDFAVVSLGGTVLCAGCTFLAALPCLKMQPKDILSDAS